MKSTTFKRLSCSLAAAVSLSVPIHAAQAATLTRGDRMACSSTSLSENQSCIASPSPTENADLNADRLTLQTFDFKLNDAIQFALDRSTTFIQYLAEVEAKASNAYQSASIEHSFVAGFAQSTVWNSEEETSGLHPIVVLTPGLVLGAAGAILGIGSLSRRADEA